MNGTQALRDTLAAALDGTLAGLAGPVHLLGEALELSPATQGLLAQHPERLHLLPAADASLVGVALGIAMSGGIAVVELADPAALVGALPQLVEASRLGGTDAPLHLVVRVPCGPDDSPLPAEQLTALLPGIAVASPSSPAEVAGLLQAALSHPGPVLLLEPRAVLSGHDSRPLDALPLGQARALRTGDHATVLAWGGSVLAALDAADSLADEGISVDVIDLRSLRPLDTATIAARVQHTGRVIVAGTADSVLLAAVQHAFLRLEAPPAIVAQADAAAIAAAARDAVHY